MTGQVGGGRGDEAECERPGRWSGAGWAGRPGARGVTTPTRRGLPFPPCRHLAHTAARNTQPHAHQVRHERCVHDHTETLLLGGGVAHQALLRRPIDSSSSGGRIRVSVFKARGRRHRTHTVHVHADAPARPGTATCQAYGQTYRRAHAWGLGRLAMHNPHVPPHRANRSRTQGAYRDYVAAALRAQQRLASLQPPPAVLRRLLLLGQVRAAPGDSGGTPIATEEG